MLGKYRINIDIWGRPCYTLEQVPDIIVGAIRLGQAAGSSAWPGMKRFGKPYAWFDGEGFL